MGKEGDPGQVLRPSREQLEAARGKGVPDVVAPGLSVLFSGINPGLYSGATGHHFARPGNRFWPLLHAAGFTPRVFSPREERELLRLGVGITNIVNRTTATARELSAEELKKGGLELIEKVRRFRPHFLAFLGIDAYRKAFSAPSTPIGEQSERINGTVVWVLPNPSGANAHYQFPELLKIFTLFYEDVRRIETKREQGL